MLEGIKLVIFDLDGVLTETSNQHFTAWQSMAKKIGVTLAPEFEEKLKGVSRTESLNRILELTDRVFSDDEKQRLQDQKNKHYQSLIQDFDESHLFEGVKPLLKLLKSKGILLALGSASKNGPTLIKALGIDQAFDYIVNPQNLRSKPHPDIFLEPMLHYGLDAKACIGIEDADAGVRAIKAANMFAIGIGNQENLPDADIHFPNILALYETLKSTQ